VEDFHVPTEKQRREAARRHLERQLQRRQEREAKRLRSTLIASVVGTVALIAVVVGFIAFTNNDKKTPTASGASGTPTGTATTSPATTPTTAAPSTSYPAAKGASVSFDGVTVVGATDLKGNPKTTSKSSTTPTKLLYKDLVVGTGAAATPKSTVTVQYVGVLYKDGKMFDSSWGRGQAAQFSLTGVVPGFTQGIGGNATVPPMKVGGRRIIIMPSALGYGAQASGPIPANSALVFVVDLKSIDG
jgi:peptidylprolyl isomerase